MKILLINAYGTPDLKKIYPSTFQLTRNLALYPSSALEQIATITPKKHRIILIDEALDQKINFDEKYDLVGISCIHTPSAPRAYKTADEFRKRGNIVVLGGWHPTILSKEAKEHADSVVVGEAEEIWPQLLKDFEEKKLKDLYSNEKPVDLENVPIRNHALFKKKSPIRSIYTSRGCPYGCNFCSITNSRFGCIFRQRPFESVIEEIKSTPQKYLVFNDASLSIDIDYTKRLFKEMKDLNKKFRCWMNVNIPIDDEEFLKLASEAGCITIEMGFESISQNTINILGKKTNKVERYKEVIKKIHDHGIAIGGVFMVGFDNDKKEDLGDNYINNVLDLELDIPRVVLCTPLPGTPFFNQPDKENRILTKDWLKYDMTHVVYKPKNMAAEELYSRWLYIMQELYSSQNCLRRILSKNKLKFSSWIWRLSYNFSFNRIVSNEKKNARKLNK